MRKARLGPKNKGCKKKDYAHGERKVVQILRFGRGHSAYAESGN